MHAGYIYLYNPHPGSYRRGGYHHKAFKKLTGQDYKTLWDVDKSQYTSDWDVNGFSMIIDPDDAQTVIVRFKSGTLNAVNGQQAEMTWPRRDVLMCGMRALKGLFGVVEVKGCEVDERIRAGEVEKSGRAVQFW